MQCAVRYRYVQPVVRFTVHLIVRTVLRKKYGGNWEGTASPYFFQGSLLLPFSKKKEWKKKTQKGSLLQQQEEDQQQISTNRNKKSKLLHGDRSDLERLQSGEWVDDGLGGKFNSEGFTGRRDEHSGFKVYKAHLFNKKGFGTTSQCPFDCDCCYI